MPFGTHYCTHKKRSSSGAAAAALQKAGGDAPRRYLPGHPSRRDGGIAALQKLSSPLSLRRHGGSGGGALPLLLKTKGERHLVKYSGLFLCLFADIVCPCLCMPDAHAPLPLPAFCCVACACSMPDTALTCFCACFVPHSISSQSVIHQAGRESSEEDWRLRSIFTATGGLASVIDQEKRERAQSSGRRRRKIHGRSSSGTGQMPCPSGQMRREIRRRYHQIKILREAAWKERHRSTHSRKQINNPSPLSSAGASICRPFPSRKRSASGIMTETLIYHQNHVTGIKELTLY